MSKNANAIEENNTEELSKINFAIEGGFDVTELE